MKNASFLKAPKLRGLILDMDGVLWRSRKPLGEIQSIFKTIDNIDRIKNYVQNFDFLVKKQQEINKKSNPNELKDFMTYHEIMEDAMNCIAWSQADETAGNYRGGWRII